MNEELNARSRDISGWSSKSAPRALISRNLPLPIERSSFVSVQRSAMAEAPDTSDKRLEELEEEITCAVFQAICLSRVSQGEATLPPGGVEELQGAFFVERMIDLFSKMAKAEGHLRDDRRIHMKPRFINMSLLRS